MSNRAIILVLQISLSAGALFPAGAPAQNSPPAQPKAQKAQEQSGAKAGARLHGHVTESSEKYPFLDGVKTTVPKGTKVDLTFSCNLNSELAQKGEEMMARVSVDLKNGEKVLLPGSWYMHGNVVEVEPQRRLGRDGYVVVEFDKLVSPNGAYELPFHATFSTADNELKAVAKVVAKDTVLVTKGAIVGSLLSVQMTGLPTAIATHGISVGVGATAGAGLALIGALKRKGNIASISTGDEKQLTIAEPLELPGFNPDALPSAAPKKKIENLDLAVLHKHFDKDPFGDTESRLLTLDLKVDNRTDKEYSFFDLAVVSDHNQRYYPFMLGGTKTWKKKVPPNSEQEGTMSFSVDSPKRKYWLVLLDKTNRAEISRVPVN